MEIIQDTNLSDIIVSIANAVSEANSVLNSDPQSSMAITKFEVDTIFTAVLSVSQLYRGQPLFKLHQASSGNFQVVDYSRPSVPAIKFQQFLQPSLSTYFVPTSEKKTAQVQIKAIIEAIPKVTQS